MISDYFYAAEAAARRDRLLNEAYAERVARAARIRKRSRRNGHATNQRHAGPSVPPPS